MPTYWDDGDLDLAIEARRLRDSQHDGTLPPREIRIHTPRPADVPLDRCLCGHAADSHTGYLPRGQSDAVCATPRCGCQWFEPALTRRQRLTNTLVWLTIIASLVGFLYLIVVTIASVVPQ